MTPEDIAKLITEDPGGYAGLPDQDEFSGDLYTLRIKQQANADEVGRNIAWVMRENGMEVGQVRTYLQRGGYLEGASSVEAVITEIEAVPSTQQAIDIIDHEMDRAGQSRLSWRLQ